MEQQLVMSSKKIVPVRITKVSKDDPDSLAAITGFQNAVEVDNIREILEQFQQEYKKTIKEIGNLLSKMKGGKTDPRTYWKVGDLIHNLLRSKAIVKGLALTNYERTMARDLEISPSRIHYFLHFRELHPIARDVNPSISWTWYIELNRLGSIDKVKRFETDIVNGKFKDTEELKIAIRSAMRQV